MKVMSLLDQWYNMITGAPATGPKYSEVCTVIGETKDTQGNEGYILQEYTSELGWLKRCFAPLSDIDELELFKERFKELQNELV